MSLRRGACPSLSEPMETGDGLLVRVSPASGMLTPRQLAGIAKAAQRHGNGLLEITRRGNLQIRGLTPQSTAPLAAEINALDIAVTSGLAVDIGPLAGIDAQEIADPRPLAALIRAGAEPFMARLGPKVSVTVDGGGPLHLEALLADVKLTATTDGWHVAIGGHAGSARNLGVMDEQEALENTLDVLQSLATQGRTARARDLALGTAPLNNARPQRSPVGVFMLKDGSSARGFALAFRQVESAALHAFANALNDAATIRLAPGGGLLVIGHDAALSGRAAELGLVTQADDPRLSITACAGAPACRSAFIAARALAADLAAQGRPQSLIHISGCIKGCARPAAPAISLTGTPQGCFLEGEASPELQATLLSLGNRYFVQQEQP
jgi:precorrin-3B synthase